MSMSDSTSTLEEKLRFGVAGPIIIYGLFFAGLLSAILPIIGVVLAYFLRKDAQGYLHSHFSFLIQTFWIAFGIYVGYFVVFSVIFLSVFNDITSFSSSDSSLTSINLDLFGTGFNLLNESGIGFSGNLIALIVIVVLFTFAFFAWYLIRLARGVRALYLGRDAPGVNPYPREP